MTFKNVSIETNRLRMIPISMKYRNVIFSEFTEEVTAYMFPRAPEKIEDTEAFITGSIAKNTKGLELQLVILDKESGDFIGCGGLSALNTKTPELGIWIKKSAHGNKYGREAVQGMKGWGDVNIPYEYMRYPVAKDNIPSKKIALSLGGVLSDEYDKKMLTGITHRILEYWIMKEL